MLAAARVQQGSVLRSLRPCLAAGSDGLSVLRLAGSLHTHLAGVQNPAALEAPGSAQGMQPRACSSSTSAAGGAAALGQHRASTSARSGWSYTLLAAGAAAFGLVGVAQCDAPAHEHSAARQPAWWAPQRYLGWVVPGAWRSPPHSPMLDEVAADPEVAVVLALALPFLALSFGYTPDKRELDEAARSLEAQLGQLAPWELAALLWCAARLGYRPPPRVMDGTLAAVECALGLQGDRCALLKPQEAALAAWALAVLEALTPDIWAALLDRIAAAPPDSLDEVTLIHLYQAGLFADWGQVSKQVSAPPGAKVAPGACGSALREGVRVKLGSLPSALVARAEQVYTAAAQQPGFDGPFLVELTILRMLASQQGALDASPTWRRYLRDLAPAELDRARALAQDPFALRKFKNEVTERRARGSNNFMRQLTDISRTLASLGIHHAQEAAVEDGLVHVDLALPDYKIAIILAGSLAAAQREHNAPRNSATSGPPAAERSRQPLRFIDPDGAMLSGYAASETPGTLQAKRALLEQCGWKVFELTWLETWRTEAEKRRAVLELVDAAGQEHAMRGRVAAMVHGALRPGQAAEKPRFEHESAGWNQEGKTRRRWRDW